MINIYSDKNKSKELSQMIAANLILESYKRLDRQLAKVTPLGKDFDIDSNTGQAERGKAISLTAGNIKLNQQLIKYINLLISEVTKKFPYQPLINKRKRQVLQALNYAIGGHFSKWEEIIQNMMVKAIGTNAIFESGQILPQALLDIQENIKEIEDKSGEENS